MANLFGNLFGGAGRFGRSQLTNDFLNSFQNEMERGHLTTGREILERQRAAGGPDWRAQRAAAQETLNEMMRQVAQGIQQGPGQLHTQRLSAGAVFTQGPDQGNHFTRWFDIRESEDELQEFLAKCVKYSAKMRNPTNMSVKDLEK